MFKLGIRSDPWWRPLVAIVVAYAVAAQTLLIALGALTIAAQADEGLPAFELCHHGQLAPDESRHEAPFHSGCNHCIFCFAASHHAVIDAPPALPRDVVAEVVEAPPPSASHVVILRSAYTIAIPRGPPLPA